MRLFNLSQHRNGPKADWKLFWEKEVIKEKVGKTKVEQARDRTKTKKAEKKAAKKDKMIQQMDMETSPIIEGQNGNDFQSNLENCHIRFTQNIESEPKPELKTKRSKKVTKKQNNRKRKRTEQSNELEDYKEESKIMHSQLDNSNLKTKYPKRQKRVKREESSTLSNESHDDESKLSQENIMQEESKIANNLWNLKQQPNETYYEKHEESKI